MATQKKATSKVAKTTKKTAVKTKKAAAKPSAVDPAGPLQVGSKKFSFNKNPKNMLVMAAIAIAVIGGGASAYINLFHNSPERIWERALNNTANGLDRILEVSQEGRKGLRVDGNFSLRQPIPVSGNSSGQFNNETGSGEFKFDIGASGIRVDAEIIADGSKGDTPDVYFKVGGLEGVGSLLDAFGGGTSPEVSKVFDGLNDQWYVVDRTLFDSLASTWAVPVGAEEVTYSEDHAKALSDELTSVLKDRLLSANEETAVFKIMEEVGKEDFEGISSYKFRVGLDKENTKTLVSELTKTLENSPLYEGLFGFPMEGNSLQTSALEDMLQGVEDSNIDQGYADVWIQASGGFVRNIRFYPVEDKKDTNYLDFLLNYEGGDVLPFLIRATVEDDGVDGTLSAGMELNQANGDLKFTLDVDMNAQGAPIKGDAELSFAGTDEEITVEAPQGARGVLELVSLFTDLTESVNATPPLPSIPGPASDDFDLESFYETQSL